MVIVRLNGGLGNQMFQYAAGKALACRLGTELKLDVGAFQKDRLRKYELGCFQIEATIAGEQEISALVPSCHVKRGKLAGLLRKYRPDSRDSIFREKHFHYDEGIHSLEDNIYIDGYWQSERYFHAISDTIRREFSFSDSPGTRDLELAAQISKIDAVSIHVRRGDYVTNPTTRKFHGLCPPAYYASAISYITERISSPRFFVFSDDPGWVKENLDIPHAVHVSDYDATERAQLDIWLMSQCQHHIIANSSFSWWGAWLCPNLKKIVVAPQTWFSTPGKDTSDLIPRGWVQL